MSLFQIRSPLYDKAAGEGGTGGAGGGEPAAPFTPEQLTALGTIVNGAFNEKANKKIAAAVSEAIGALKIGETIAAEVAKLKPDPPEPKPGEGKPDPKITALETKLADVTKQLQTEAAERQKAVEEGKAKDAKAALRSALTPHVRPEALDLAVRDLFDAQKRVTLDEQGNPLIKVRRKDYAGADEEVDMPLADGVGHWIKTTEGKFFAPPPSGGGDPKGGQGPRRTPQLGGDGLPKYDAPATTDEERVRRAEEREQAFRQRHPNLT